MSEAFLTGLAKGSVEVGLLIGLVLVARKLVAPRWRAYLWVIVVVRLLVPFGPPFVYSVHRIGDEIVRGFLQTGLVETGSMEADVPSEIIDPIVPESLVPDRVWRPEARSTAGVLANPAASSPSVDSIVSEPTGTVELEPSSAPVLPSQRRIVVSNTDNVTTNTGAVSLSTVLLTLWLAGAAVLAFRWLVGIWWSRRLLRRSRPERDLHVLGALDDCLRQLGCRFRIGHPSFCGGANPHSRGALSSNDCPSSRRPFFRWRVAPCIPS